MNKEAIKLAEWFEHNGISNATDSRRAILCLKDLREEICALKTERTLLRAVVDSLPRCSPWLSGSGGHKIFGDCPHIATWEAIDDDGLSDGDEWFCDEHRPPHYIEKDWLKETFWAEEVRLLEGFESKKI